MPADRGCAPHTAATVPTWRYKLRATGWFCSVMKKVPRFSSFFRWSTTV